MKSQKIILSSVTTAALALSLAACSAPSTNTTTNTTANANKANTAVVTNSNTTNSMAPVTTTNTATSATNTGANAGGDTINLEEAGITMTAPKGFKISKDGETTNLISPDDAFEVYFHVPKDGDYDKAIDDITTEIDDYIKDVKVTAKGENREINGMPAYLISGTGVDKEDGKNVAWDLIVLKTAKKPVLIVSYADEGTSDKYDAQITDLVKSIKKM
ncbi:MAG TPA: hypothetical protein VEX64_07765 [Pyrinomonadaceae bacterium]|jgi:hypothetical protein|nr:hypothetical protein [Pyrinomonadaceae bacterium]